MRREELQKQANKLQVELDNLNRLIAMPSTPTIEEVYLFLYPIGKKWHYLNKYGISTVCEDPSTVYASSHTTNKETEATKLYIVWKNIAAYVEGGKRFQRSKSFKGYYILNREDGKYQIEKSIGYDIPGVIYFSSKETAQQAIDIMGEDRLRRMLQF